MLYEVDSSGQTILVAADQSDGIISLSGMLSIPIPDDLHYTNSHSLYVTVYGVNGASVFFRNFPINGLSDNPGSSY